MAENDDRDVVQVGYFVPALYFTIHTVRAEFRFSKHIAYTAADVLRQLTA